MRDAKREANARWAERHPDHARAIRVAASVRYARRARAAYKVLPRVLAALTDIEHENRALAAENARLRRAVGRLATVAPSAQPARLIPDGACIDCTAHGEPLLPQRVERWRRGGEDFAFGVMAEATCGSRDCRDWAEREREPVAKVRGAPLIHGRA